MTTNHELEIGHPADETEVRAFVATVGEALFFSGTDADRDTWVEREGRENIRVARLGGRVAGGLTVQRMGQWFGGRSVPMGAVRAVGVAPEYRASGIASGLMRAALEELYRDGVPLSVLYAATQPVYRRPGFELAGMRLSYRLPTRGIDVRDRALELRRIEPSDHEAIHEAYAERARRTSGNLDRSPWSWQRILDPPPWNKKTHGFLVTREGRVEGYVVYTQQAGDTLENSHRLDATDLVVLTADAGRRLLTFFADHRSMVENVTFRGSPADPLLYLLAEQECTIASRIDWMLRIVDVRGALEARGYPAGIEAELHLCIEDDVLAQNARRFVLEVSDGGGQVREGGEGCLRIDVRGLAPLYTGHLSPVELKAIGHVDGPDRDMDIAGTVFAGPAPWMPDVF